MDKIDLSTLLRLKKFERPDEAFWDGFDTKLRQRTLKALIERTSVRSRIYLKLHSVMRGGMAMPAAAAIAVALYFALPQQLESPVRDTAVTEEATVVAVNVVTPLTADTPIEAQFKPQTISAPAKEDTGYTKKYAQQIMTADEELYFVASTMTMDYGISLSPTSSSSLF